jgi:hypothetical protein
LHRLSALRIEFGGGPFEISAGPEAAVVPLADFRLDERIPLAVHRQQKIALLLRPARPRNTKS